MIALPTCSGLVSALANLTVRMLSSSRVLPTLLASRCVKTNFFFTNWWKYTIHVLKWEKKYGFQVSDKMNPSDLVKLIEILNPSNKPGRITIITRMGAENMRVKLPHLIRAVRQAGLIVTWITDPMHGNTIKAPCGLKTRPFDSILVCSTFLLVVFILCLSQWCGLIDLHCLAWKKPQISCTLI